MRRFHFYASTAHCPLLLIPYAGNRRKSQYQYQEHYTIPAYKWAGSFPARFYV